MNLRVDLILESEKRSPSVVTPKFLIRLSSTLVPAIVVLLVASTVMGNMRLSSKLKQMQAEWKTLEPKKKHALQTTQQRTASLQMQKAFDGYRHSRLVMWEQVDGLRYVVPSEIQLLSFRFNQQLSVGEGNVTVRTGLIFINGKSLGETAESNCTLIEKRFNTQKPFGDTVNSVVMRGQPDTSPGAKRDDLVFTIDYRYTPRRFLQ